MATNPQFAGAKGYVPGVGVAQSSPRGFLQNLATIWGAPTFAEGYSKTQNLKALDAQYAYEQSQEAQKRRDTAQYFGNYTNVPQTADGQTYLSPEELTAALPYQGRQDYGKAAVQYSNGEIPTSYGIADPTQVQQTANSIFNRRIDQQDKGATLNSMPGYFQGGQNMSANSPQFTRTPGGFIQAAGIGQPSQAMPSALDDGTGAPQQFRQGQPIQAAAQQSVMPTQSLPPLFGGVVDPNFAQKSFDSGMTDQHNARVAAETQRNNQFKNRTDMIQAQADKERADKYQVFAPAGPQMNEAGYANQAFHQGILSPEQYAQTFQHAGAGPSVPSTSQNLQLGILKSQASPSNGFFGIGAHPADENARAQYNRYATKYGLNPLPFGGQGQANLQKTIGRSGIMSPAEWKKNRG